MAAAKWWPFCLGLNVTPYHVVNLVYTGSSNGIESNAHLRTKLCVIWIQIQQCSANKMAFENSSTNLRLCCSGFKMLNKTFSSCLQSTKCPAGKECGLTLNRCDPADRNCHKYTASCSKSGIHYKDVIMSTMESQITSPTFVYSTVYSGTYQRKHQSSASLALWGEFTSDWWIPRTKGQWRGKSFHLMTSSCPCWPHYMETLSALLAFCEGDPTVTGGNPLKKGSVMRSFDVFLLFAIISFWTKRLVAGDLRRDDSNVIPQKLTKATSNSFQCEMVAHGVK